MPRCLGMRATLLFVWVVGKSPESVSMSVSVSVSVSVSGFVGSNDLDMSGNGLNYADNSKQKVYWS